MTEPKRILLIEDEPNILEVLRFLFVREGWHVTATSNGSDALRIAQEVHPALIVLDVMLPDISGYDVLQNLRQSPYTAQMPILILTARGQEKDKAIAQDRGASAFMTKPFSNAAVIELARSLMEA